MAAQKIHVGDIARDSVTGFKGMVIARTEWLNGCARVTIQPQKLKDGKTIDAETFDEQQVEVVRSKYHSPNRETGGPRPTPIRQKDPV